MRFYGEGDAVFNNEDYLLFYAIGPKYYNPDNNSHINPYSDQAYYYVKIDNENGLRMSAASEPSLPADTTFTSFHDYQFVHMTFLDLGSLRYCNNSNSHNNHKYMSDHQSCNIQHIQNNRKCNLHPYQKTKQ